MDRGTIGPRELAERLGRWSAGGRPLAESLAAGIAALIAEGALPPGTRLPAERRLADRLTVSRGTVIAAFEQLRSDGLVVTRHGSGSEVTPVGSPVSGPREAHVTGKLDDDSIVRGLLPDDAVQIDLRAADWHGTDDLPDDAFDVHTGAAVGHGYEVLGIERLRTAIADHLGASGLTTSPEQILVTSGAQQAISLITQLIVGPRDTVVVEALTYPGAVDAATTQQARLAVAPLGQHGVELAGLERAIATHRPRLAYLVPSVHNPTGRSLPGAARARLVELAASWDTTIIDDRTLADTLVDGTPAPPLAAYADHPAVARRIVTIGSLSKSMWGGLRVGWIRARPELIHRLARLRSVTDLGSPVHPQLIAASLLERADTILPARRERLRARYDLVEAELRAALPGWRWQRPGGGLCLWIDPDVPSVEALCAAAAAQGVGLVPGAAFSPSGEGSTHLRLPVGHPPDVLRDAIARLAVAAEHLGAGRART